MVIRRSVAGLVWLVAVVSAGGGAAGEEVGSVLLTVRETGGVARQNWPVTCGIPFADRQLRADRAAAGQFRLVDQAGQAVACQAEVAATWGTYPGGSDGYVKWLHLGFHVDLPGLGVCQYRFEWGAGVVNPSRTDLVVTDGAESVTVSTGKGPGALRLVISKRRFNLFDEVFVDVAGDGFGREDRIISPRKSANLWVGYDLSTARINAGKPEVVVEQAGPVVAVVRISTKLDGRFESVVRIFAYANCPYVRVQETLIHGPRGQDRSGVQPQAVVMKSHVLELPLNLDGEGAVVTVGVGEALPEPPQFGSRSVPVGAGAGVVLEQDLAHGCGEGNVRSDGLSKAFGYAVYAGGERIDGGKRAPGWVDVSDTRWGVTAAVRYFWQSFPKRLVGGASSIRLEHWASGAQLEPLSRNYNWMGMAKTHDVWLYFHRGGAASAGAERVALGYLSELFATCEPEYYCSTGAYGRQRLTPAVQNGRRVHADYDRLLSAGLNRERSISDGFYYLREREDAYGYFNFGDFLVGNYWGCQEYDPGYCMLEQFYRTGELKYLEFGAECGRYKYDMLYSHSFTPDSSNYPQRSHDKRGSHFAGEDSHGQRDMDTDPGHVFIAGLVNYWFLTGDRRARDVIFWSLPVYLAEDWYRMSGSGTWRYLGGYLFTVLTYAYELTWDDRYIEPMLWAVREYMVNNWSRHADGVWWNGDEDGGYICQPWLADSISNGYTQLLEVYPGCPYRDEIESAVVNLADFLLARCFTENFDGLYAQLLKPSVESAGYRSSGRVYRKSMGNMAVLTLARAYYLTGEQKYLGMIRKILDRVISHTGNLGKLKPIAQGTYYAPMVLPYLEGSLKCRDRRLAFEVVEPVNGWIGRCWQVGEGDGDREGVMFLGDELASACAPGELRGRGFGNAAGFRLSDALGAIDDLLARHRPRYVVIVVGGSDLASGHPERVDFEANYTWLVRRILAAGSVPICVTLPPCSHLEPFGWIYNAVIYQAARLNRVPLIDVHELMRGQGPEPVNNEPGVGKVPPVDWVKRNRFVPGHEQLVAAKLAEIIGQMEGE